MPAKSGVGATVVGGTSAAKLTVVGGSALAVLAARLPWLATPVWYHPDGTGTSLVDLNLVCNGVVTAVLAGVAVGLVIGREPDGDAAFWSVAVGGLISLVAATYVLAPSVVVGGGPAWEQAASVTTVGAGVYLTILGGLFVVAGGLLAYDD